LFPLGVVVEVADVPPDVDGGCGDVTAVVVLEAGAVVVTSNASTQTQEPPDAAFFVPVTSMVSV
jgi:hypothetical protein